MKKIYIIGTENGPYKIGISENPSKRLKQLQTASSETLNVLFEEIIEFDNPFEFEKILHHNLKFNKLKGEWFNLNFDDILLEIEYAKIRYSDEKDALKKVRASIIKS